MRQRLLIALLFAPSISFATTPTISDVTGTVSTGQTLTVTGGNMMDEDKTNWDPMFKTGTMYGFEGSSYTDDGYAEAPEGRTGATLAYDSTVALTGSKSYKGRLQGTFTDCTAPVKRGAGLAVYPEVGVGAGGFHDWYVRGYFRWSSVGSGHVWPENFIKMIDTQGENGAWQFYVQPSPSPTDGSTLPTTISMIYGGIPHDQNVSNFLQLNRWYAIEARFDNATPPNFTLWVDGVLINNVTNPTFDTPWNAVLFNMINACGYVNMDLSNWTDNFTVSSSRVYPSSKIEIADGSTYATATKVYQELIALEDGTVQIKANLTGLGAGPYYLFVTNNRQEVSSAYNLSGEQPPINGGARLGSGVARLGSGGGSFR